MKGKVLVFQIQEESGILLCSYGTVTCPLSLRQGWLMPALLAPDTPRRLVAFSHAQDASDYRP